MSAEVRARFELYRDELDEDQCWNWFGTREARGYGRFWHENRSMPAHRVAWMLYRGPIESSEIYVCHSCDNPKCVNPNHLWLGTAWDNSNDSHRKGRHPKGRDKPSAKLTEHKARDIFLDTSMSQQDLADYYGVHVVIIQRICSRKTWAHATRNLVAPNRRSTARLLREHRKQANL